MLKNNSLRTPLQGFYKTLFFIAVPIILQNLMQTFVNMLDTIMVGQLGAAEIAAVGLGNQIFFILNMILFGISSGGSIFITQFWGKKDLDGIHKTMGIMLTFSTIISLVFCIAGLTVPQVLIGFYSKDPVVIAFGAKYLRAVAPSYVIMALGFPFQLAFRSTEHVHLPMICTAVSFAVNALFNYALIFGFSFDFFGMRFTVNGMGVTGAAVATVIARSLETALLLIISYAKKFEAAGSVRSFLKFDRYFVYRFIRIALPVLINETFWGMGITVENAIFSRMGTDAIAAFNITGTISQLTWVFFIGTGNATGIILGKKIGEGKKDETRLYANRFAWFLPLCAVGIGLLLYPLSFLLPYLFNVEPHIIKTARHMLYVLICFYPFNAFAMYFIVGFCRAGGDTKFAAFHDIFWMWTIAIPAGIFAAFVLKLSPPAVYFCLLTEGVLKTFWGLARLKSGKWLKDVTE